MHTHHLLRSSLAALALLLPSAFTHAADVPRTLDELWAGYAQLDRETPLEAEVLKEWEKDGIVCRIVRYQVGVFKGAPSRVAGLYAFPKGATKLPTVLHLHGGGQSANLDSVVTYAKRGYASLSLNWGGNKMGIGGETWSGPQTDWGKLDATHPPQRNKANHFAGALTPDEFTLDAVESPRNSNWFLVLTAARRAITFLETQPEVDASRIGVHGHSMGGKLTTNLAGIDKRIKAAVPSCGGAGDLLESQTDVPGGSRAKRTAMELACVSDNAYIPLITCPVLWLSPTNDFNANIDNMAWNWRNVPDDRLRFSIAPHLNHRHTSEHTLTDYLWFEEHLKGAAFKMPATPQIALILTSQDGIPRVSVTPDASQRVQRVDIYYSHDPHALTRFWRDAKAVKSDAQWQAECPVMSLDQPLFVFANVAYETPPKYRVIPLMPGDGNSETFAISTRVLAASPSQLQAAKVKPTDKPGRLVDDGSRGWHDWYRLTWGHASLWTAATRKLKDTKWRGPDGATLHFETKCETDNQLVLTFNCNAWDAFAAGKPAIDYTVLKPLKGSPDWQEVTVHLSDLAANDPKITTLLANWQTVTEFSISPKGTIVKDGQPLSITGIPWKGQPEVRNLRWEGGEYSRQTAPNATPSTEEFGKSFNDAIKKSLEQEKADQRPK
jgi:cephalosporin-C deacetylase-like acetyl esterase